MYYVYILKNSRDKTYVGQTRDLEKRLAEHNDPEYYGTQYTKRIPGPWTLIHREAYGTRSEAMLREKELKNGRGRDWIKRHILGGC